MSQQDESFDQLPDAIVSRLAARDRAVSVMTPSVDRALGEAARAQFAGRNSAVEERPFTRRRRHIPYAAAAAVALVAFLVIRPFDQAGLAPLELSDDVDGSGRIDVLDAFALARSRAADPGAVPAEQLDELMRRIVAVNATEGVL